MRQPSSLVLVVLVQASRVTCILQSFWSNARNVGRKLLGNSEERRSLGTDGRRNPPTNEKSDKG